MMPYNKLSSLDSDLDSSSHPLSSLDLDTSSNSDRVRNAHLELDIVDLTTEGEVNGGADAPDEVNGSSSEEISVDENSTKFERLHILAKRAVPCITAFFLSLGGNFINMAFAGQYKRVGEGDSVVFAGVSLSTMFANVSCISLIVGMSSTVETLGSQYNGAKDYRAVGIVLQRSILILAVMSIPIVISWTFVDSIFLALGVEKSVCDVMRTFLRIRVLTIPMDIVNISYEKYLMAIGVVRPSLYSSTTFNVSLLVLDVIFVHFMRLDYECLAWSFVIANYLAAIMQIAFSLEYVQVQRTLQPWSMESLREWGEFIKLGIPGAAMLCSEWWAYEALTMFASVLGTEQVAAQTIILQIASLAFMVPLGLGIATCSLVGNSLGASKTALAIQMSQLALQLIFFLEILVGFIILNFGGNFINIFTVDEKVHYYTNRALPFLSLFTMLDGLQGVSSGILRGCGKQSIGAVTNIVAFYLIGLPMAWLLCFRAGLAVNGLMIGISFGTVFQVAVLLYYIFGRESQLFTSRIKVSAEETHDGSSCSENMTRDQNDTAGIEFSVLEASETPEDGVVVRNRLWESSDFQEFDEN